MQQAFDRLDARADPPSKLQPGGPGTKIICPGCGRESDYAGDASKEELGCSDCGTIVVNGVVQRARTETRAA